MSVVHIISFCLSTWFCTCCPSPSVHAINRHTHFVDSDGGNPKPTPPPFSIKTGVGRRRRGERRSSSRVRFLFSFCLSRGWRSVRILPVMCRPNAAHFLRRLHAITPPPPHASSSFPFHGARPRKVTKVTQKKENKQRKHNKAHKENQLILVLFVLCFVSTMSRCQISKSF
jgi:hypothetical protein